MQQNQLLPGSSLHTYLQLCPTLHSRNILIKKDIQNKVEVIKQHPRSKSYGLE